MRQIPSLSRRDGPEETSSLLTQVEHVKRAAEALASNVADVEKSGDAQKLNAQELDQEARGLKAQLEGLASDAGFSKGAIKAKARQPPASANSASITASGSGRADIPASPCPLSSHLLTHSPPQVPARPGGARDSALHRLRLQGIALPQGARRGGNAGLAARIAGAYRGRALPTQVPSWPGLVGLTNLPPPGSFPLQS